LRDGAVVPFESVASLQEKKPTEAAERRKSVAPGASPGFGIIPKEIGGAAERRKKPHAEPLFFRRSAAPRIQLS
jgi:hypothetical protein